MNKTEIMLRLALLEIIRLKSETLKPGKRINLHSEQGYYIAMDMHHNGICICTKDGDMSEEAFFPWGESDEGATVGFLQEYEPHAHWKYVAKFREMLEKVS